MQTDNREKSGEGEDYPSAGYAWYVVAVLTLAYMVSFIDRQILSLLVRPIRTDLGISDTEISLLMGLTFAVFYTLFGIPLGRLADTGSRRSIIAAGIGFWSLMTAGCGLAKSFWQLALMRVGVGVGEAALSPSAYSLIADYFRPERRATAMSVYSMGIFIGSGLAFVLGAAVATFAAGQEDFVVPVVGTVRSWQLVFLVVGVPGLAVGLLLYTIREPSRKGGRRLTDGGMAPATATPREVWAYLSDNWKTFACLNLGTALISLSSYGMSSWVPEMFGRRYGWTIRERGTVFGLIVGIAGTLGIVTGGRVADWLNDRGSRDSTVRVAAFSALAWLPFGVLYPLMPAGTWSATLLVPAVFLASMPFGVVPAAIQRMMPNPMRAQATAVYLFVINLIGMGVGPTIVALLTDKVFRDENALHQALAIVGGVSQALAAILLFAGLSHYRRSLDYFTTWNEGETGRPRMKDPG